MSDSGRSDGPLPSRVIGWLLLGDLFPTLVLIEDPCYPHRKISLSWITDKNHKILPSSPYICPAREHTQFQVHPICPVLAHMPSQTLYPVLVHMSNPRLYFNYFLLFALHAHNSWFISTSYAMSTSILITFMFMVPGRLLQRDVPPVHRHPTVTSGDPTPSTRLPEGC